MSRIPGSVVLLLSICTTSVLSQSHVAPRGRWAIGLAVGMSSFSAGTEGLDADGQRLEFSPYRPTMWGVAAAYGREGLRFNLAARYGEPGLGARGKTVSDQGEQIAGGLVVVPEAYHLASFTLGASTRLLRLRGGPALRPSLALNLERWTGVGAPTRSVLGGQTGLALEVALTRAFVGTLEGELGYSPASPFRKEDLPEGFQQRGVWRRTLAGGISWRF